MAEIIEPDFDLAAQEAREIARRAIRSATPDPEVVAALDQIVENHPENSAIQVADTPPS